MTNNINSILFFLQTLHYRDDLEKCLFEKLNSKEIIYESEVDNLYGQKVHSTLITNTKSILLDFGVIVPNEEKYQVNREKVKYFIEMVGLAKAARQYKWPIQKQSPLLYISPPKYIPSDLAGDVDDISNLLINLVSSAKNDISIMSPFTNKEGIKSILSPLKSCLKYPAINIFLVMNENDEAMIYKQIKSYIPEKMLAGLTVYFCSMDKIEDDSLPHAKLLVTDSKRGYLGSANFTKQGLNTRFELGVELNELQSRTVNKLLKMLIDKGLFYKYEGNTV